MWRSRANAGAGAISLISERTDTLRGGADVGAWSDRSRVPTVPRGSICLHRR